MSLSIPYNISFTSNHTGVFGDIGIGLDKVDTKTKKLTKSFGACFKELLSFSLALDGISQLETGLTDLITPGVALNSEMAELAAITGLADEELKKIEKSARSSAGVFGTDASQNIESYKILLSKLSPEIAQNNEALALMGENVGYTSKLMGGNSVAATGVLTTAMNQYGVSLEDPLQASKEMGIMMNIMAAGAKEGSAELPEIASALENVGLMAKSSSVSFAETNAAIQILDKSGKKGAEGGVALRNVLSTLSQGRFLPRDIRKQLQGAGVDISQLTNHSIPLTERLKGLKPVLSDNALITKLFGKENSAAALALLQNLDALEQLTPKLEGTNTAVEQAEIIMGSYQEGMNRWKAKIDDLKIGFFNLTESMMPAFQSSLSMITSFGQLAVSSHALLSIWSAKDQLMAAINLKWLKNITLSNLFTTSLNRVNIQMGIGAVMSQIQSVGLKAVAMSFGQATFGATLFKIALDALGIGLIITGVVLLIAGIKHLWENSKGFHEILGYIGGVGKAVFHNISLYATRLWDMVLKPIALGIGDFFSSAFSIIGDVVTGIFDGVVMVITGVWDYVIKPIGMAIFNFYSWYYGMLWDIVVWIWDSVIAVGTFIWDWFSSTFSGLASFITDILIDPIREAFSGTWEWITGLLDGIFNKLDGLLTPIKNLWNSIFSSEGTISVHQSGLDGAKKAGEEFDKKKETENSKESAPITNRTNLKVGTVGGVAAKKTMLSTSDSKTQNQSSGKGGGSLSINKLVETINIYQGNAKLTKNEITKLIKEALLTATADHSLA
ncbi:MAG: phage tail tape measure protein [Flavobacteriales bacterium]